MQQLKNNFFARKEDGRPNDFVRFIFILWLSLVIYLIGIGFFHYVLKYDAELVNNISGGVALIYFIIHLTVAFDRKSLDFELDD